MVEINNSARTLGLVWDWRPLANPTRGGCEEGRSPEELFCTLLFCLRRLADGLGVEGSGEEEKGEDEGEEGQSQVGAWRLGGFRIPFCSLASSCVATLLIALPPPVAPQISLGPPQKSQKCGRPSLFPRVFPTRPSSPASLAPPPLS